VVVQAPFGLGRVTLVAFDLDRSPFIDFGPRDVFWDWLLRTGGAERASVGGTGQGQDPYVNGFDTGREDELATGLRTHIDTFEGVPVISFGWVALFIALYTLLIGPIEYLFLKKIVGRLELTWVTFPLIVLSVSAAAYFTAYAIKGHDLKVNKVDVVDVDPAGGRVYGRSWFTLFSPRIDSYTVGAEPRDGWTVARPGVSDPPATVDWMAGGVAAAGASSAGGTATTPTRRAEVRGRAGRGADPGVVHEGVHGQLERVHGPATPLAESGLYHPPGDRTAVVGDFVCRLPVKELRDAVLIYAGKVYRLDPVVPGVRVAPVLDPTTADANWFAQAGTDATVGPAAPVYGRGGYTRRHRT
jgi:hypothetical protein